MRLSSFFFWEPHASIFYIFALRRRTQWSYCGRWRLARPRWRPPSRTGGLRWWTSTRTGECGLARSCFFPQVCLRQSAGVHLKPLFSCDTPYSRLTSTGHASRRPCAQYLQVWLFGACSVDICIACSSLTDWVWVVQQQRQGERRLKHDLWSIGYISDCFGRSVPLREFLHLHPPYSSAQSS